MAKKVEKIDVSYNLSWVKDQIQEVGREQAERFAAKELMLINKKVFDKVGVEVAEEQHKADLKESKKTAQPSAKKPKKKKKK